MAQPKGHPPTVTDIVLAIPTYRRLPAIEAAVRASLPQVESLEAETGGDARATLLVVDNDPDASARDLITSLGARYVHEPRPGIAAVRNRAIAEAGSADAIVFIDDDEVPQPQWLKELVKQYLRTGADAVAGKVLTIVPDDAEEWIQVSDAFVRPVRADGQVIPEAASNNLLLDLESLRRLQLAFDEEFGLTGGSDSMITRLLTKRGGVIRWAERAVVVEREDPQRFTRRWVLMRVFRFGNTSARVQIALAKGSALASIRARAWALGAGVSRFVGGSVRALFGIVTRSLRHRAFGERTAARGMGLIAASVGYAHDEYGRRRRTGTM